MVLPFIDDGMLSEALDASINLYEMGTSKYGLRDGIPTMIELGCITHDKRQHPHEFRIVTNDRIFQDQKLAKKVFAKIANDLVDHGSIPYCVFIAADVGDGKEHTIIVAGRTSDGRTRSANVYVAQGDDGSWHAEKIEIDVNELDSNVNTMLRYIDYLYNKARERKSFVERNAILKTSRN